MIDLAVVHVLFGVGLFPGKRSKVFREGFVRLYVAFLMVIAVGQVAQLSLGVYCMARCGKQYQKDGVTEHV